MDTTRLDQVVQRYLKDKTLDNIRTLEFECVRIQQCEDEEAGLAAAENAAMNLGCIGPDDVQYEDPYDLPF